jgi:hypothetical protein
MVQDHLTTAIFFFLDFEDADESIDSRVSGRTDSPVYRSGKIGYFSHG